MKMNNPKVHKPGNQLSPTMKTVRYLDRNQIRKSASFELPTEAVAGIRRSQAFGFELSKQIAALIIKKLRAVKQHVEESARMRGH
jgi:hypothetical protein